MKLRRVDSEKVDFGELIEDITEGRVDVVLITSLNDGTAWLIYSRNRLTEESEIKVYRARIVTGDGLIQ